MIRILLVLLLSFFNVGIDRVAVRFVDPEPPEVIDKLPEGLPDTFPLRFSSLGRDFGRIKTGALIEGEFWYRNTSTAPVRVFVNEDIYSGQPGCSIPSRIVAPGEARRVRYHVNTLHRRGEYHSIINLGIAADLFAAAFPIDATIIPDVFFEPIKLYLMEVPTGEGKEYTIFACGRGIDFDVTDINVTSNDVHPAPLAISQGTSEAVFLWNELYIRIPITIRVLPGAPIGEYMYNIAFVTNREQP